MSLKFIEDVTDIRKLRVYCIRDGDLKEGLCAICSTQFDRRPKEFQKGRSRISMVGLYPFGCDSYVVHGKKFGADAAPSGEAVAFSGGELCDYAFGYSAFPLWMSSCPFMGDQLTYVEGTQRSFR